MMMRKFPPHGALDPVVQHPTPVIAWTLATIWESFSFTYLGCKPRPELIRMGPGSGRQRVYRWYRQHRQRFHRSGRHGIL